MRRSDCAVAASTIRRDSSLASLSRRVASALLFASSSAIARVRLVRRSFMVSSKSRCTDRRLASASTSRRSASARAASTIRAASARALAMVCSNSTSSAARRRRISASCCSRRVRSSVACCSATDITSAASACAFARSSEASSDARRSMREMRSLIPSAVVGGTESRSTSWRNELMSSRASSSCAARFRAWAAAASRSVAVIRSSASKRSKNSRTSSRSYPLRTTAKGSGAARRSES